MRVPSPKSTARVPRREVAARERSFGLAVMPVGPERSGRPWTLLTSHGRVLLIIARDSEVRLRDVAERARITERAAATIVRDLEEAGYLTKERVGRRNHYVVHEDVGFRHPAESEHPVSELIAIFADN